MSKERFHELLNRLQAWDETPLTGKEIALLSDMTFDEERAFRKAWPRIPLHGRRLLLQRLVEISEADVQMDFTDVFLPALEDPDEQVRLLALDGLWEYDKEPFAETLIQMMNSDPSVQVRAQAAMGLAKYALAAELEEIGPETTARVRQALMAVWSAPDQDVEVRRRALESVSCFSGEDIMDMIRTAYHDKDERMNASAVFAMGHTLDESWAPYVLKELKSPRPEMRYEAAQAAGELQLMDAVPTLLDMIHDPDTDVRIAAIEALGLIGGERAVQALMELAQNENEAIREAALDALDEARFAEDPLAPSILSWLIGQNTGTLLGGIDWDEDLDEDLDEDEALDEDDFEDDEDEDEWARDLDRDRWN